MAPLLPLSIDVLKIMKGAIHSLYEFCVPSSAYALHLLLAIAQFTHCVIYGVLSSLDRTTQFVKLVWRNSSAFLKIRFLLVPRASREKSFFGGQLPPVTSLLPDFNGFAISGVLGLFCRLSLLGSRCQKVWI